MTRWDTDDLMCIHMQMRFVLWNVKRLCEISASLLIHTTSCTFLSFWSHGSLTGRTSWYGWRRFRHIQSQHSPASWGYPAKQLAPTIRSWASEPGGRKPLAVATYERLEILMSFFNRAKFFQGLTAHLADAFFFVGASVVYVQVRNIFGIYT